MAAATPRGTGFRYWAIVLILVALGFLAIFSIGLYFWFIALALILLSPFRSRPAIFLPGAALLIGFLVGYVLMAPFGCSQSFTSDPTTGEESVSPVVCTSPIGIEYSGVEPFEPSRTAALAVGSAAAVVASAMTLVAVRSRNDPESVRVDT